MHALKAADDHFDAPGAQDPVASVPSAEPVISRWPCGPRSIRVKFLE